MISNRVLAETLVLFVVGNARSLSADEYLRRLKAARQRIMQQPGRLSPVSIEVCKILRERINEVAGETNDE